MVENIVVIKNLKLVGNNMRLLIAGSRSIEVTNDQLKEYIFRFYKKEIYPDSREIEIVSGGASGVDFCAERFANQYRIIKHIYPARWSLGRGGGHIRNAEMADFADELLLIWDGVSKGSAGMKALMEKNNKPINEVIIMNG
jgi:hypothetical protein